MYARKPKDAQTDALYKILLQNQFHDILPGTSIASVNERARREEEKEEQAAHAAAQEEEKRNEEKGRTQ